MSKLLFVLLLGASTLANAAASQFTFSAAPGKYPVGLRVVEQYDYARVFKMRTDMVTGAAFNGERARPIQTVIWYPAQHKGKPMIYGDYFATLASEDGFGRSASEVAKRTEAAIADALGPRGEVGKQALARATFATRNAAPLQGQFPVVVYAPSLGSSSMENADLCEYLASQGYLVIASPSVGARSRAMTSDLEGLETQAADIAFLIAYARSLPQADMRHIGVIGYSWGGLSNIIAASRDDRIGAVVSLDGSVRAYGQYVDGGKNAAKSVTPARLTAPFLFVGARPRSVESINRLGVNTSFSLMNTMKHADVYILSMMPMAHSDFDAYMLRFGPDASFTDYSREEASTAYTWSARYVHRFLDAYLKADASAKTFINNKPVANGVPPHMMFTDIRPAQSAPPTAETLASVLGMRGFDNAVMAYESMKEKEPTFGMEARALNSWGYELLQSGRKKEAVEIFKLAVHVYPADGNAYDSLAEAYQASGNKDQAIKHYRRALELNPKNANAAAKLKALKPA